MCIFISKAVWLLQDLKPSEKLVLLLFADYADKRGVCWPSVNTVSEACRLNQRQIRRIITTLAKEHYLVITKRPGRGSIYQVTPDKGVRGTGDAGVHPFGARPLTSKTAGYGTGVTSRSDISYKPPNNPYKDKPSNKSSKNLDQIGPPNRNALSVGDRINLLKGFKND